MMPIKGSGRCWSRVGIFFFQAEDGIRDLTVTGVQTCALPISRESEIERLAADRPKRGLRLTARVVNPFNGAEIPLFIANYVLMGYGTGAIMAVPGEDQRDWDFATQHGLPIIETVKRPDGWAGQAYTGDGVKINSRVR